jgi:hypothetical protein
MTDIHLINWTIEEAKLLKAERSQHVDEIPIPSLDQIFIWPEGDPTGQAIEPVHAKSVQIQSPSETTSVASPSNDGIAGPEADTIPHSPVAVSVTFSISTDVQSKEIALSQAATAFIKSDVPAVAVDRDRMIALRWVLRDIRSNRLTWWPVKQHDLQALIEMRLVEMRDGNLMLTDEGDRALE